MDNLNNIFLYEHSEEAMEAVKSGDAIISSGGILRKGENGKGFLELAKPSVMSVADLMSLFEGKEQELKKDTHLEKKDMYLTLTNDSLKEITNVGWLNNALIKRNYVVTYEGFCHTLNGIENVIKQMSEIEEYIRKRDNEELLEKTQTYLNYLKTDSGNMLSEKYSVVNGNIAEHLDKISAFIKRLINIIEADDTSEVIVQILCNLINPFAYVIRKYSSLYYYENDGKIMPGNYDEWIKVLSLLTKSAKLKELVEYYIMLNVSIPYRDKVKLIRETNQNIKCIISNVGFEKRYIQSHSKDQYLLFDNQIRKKIRERDYTVIDNSIIIFLDSDN